MSLRIERIDLSPWGCFEDHSLSFSSEPGEVDLIHGPNASGKSTASRAERSLLYGIEARTPDSHTYDYADLRIGARLALDGVSVELSRHKRRGGSLVSQKGEPLPEDVILMALGGLTEEVYAALFQVDHETLVQGGAELLQGRGEIGSSLFAAAAGAVTLHDTLAGLDAEAERLFSPRARTTVLHKALASLREAEKRLRGATLRPARHREMERSLLEAEEACEELTRQMRQLELRARALERKRAIAPLLDAHSERMAELEGLAGTPQLPGSAATQRSDAQGRLLAGTRALERAKSTAAKLEAEFEEIVLDEKLIARGEEIRIIKESVSAISKAGAEERKREDELLQARTALRAAAEIIGVDPSDIESLRRPASARRALDRCLRQREELASRRSAARIQVKDAERARDHAQADLDGAALAADVRQLDAAITAALRAGTLSEQIEQGRLEAKLQRGEATGRLERLMPAPSSTGALRALQPPSGEQAARAAAQNEELRRASENLRSEARRLADAESELREELERLTLAGEAPTTEMLAKARERRDEQWAAIRRVGTGGSPLQPADAEGFERALAGADHLADSRTDHAAQIERTAAAHARARRLKRERTVLHGREAELHAREEALHSEWEKAWALTGLQPVLAEDAGAWLDEREKILDLDRGAAERQARTDSLAARERGHAGALSACLRGLRQDLATGEALDTLIARGQAVLTQAREQTNARSALQATLLGAERALAGAKHAQSSAAAAWAEWEKRWPARRAEAGLPDTATPQAAQEIVRAVQDGLSQLERTTALERRIAGIRKDQAEFAARVRGLCEQLAPELATLDPEQAASELHSRLTGDERRLAKREGLSEQRAALASELTVLHGDIATARAEIDALLAAAGTGDVEELPEIETRAARASVLRDEIAEIERQVAKAGDGRFSELAEGACGFDRDQASVELDELREQAEALRVARDETKERIGERKRELAEAESDTTAVQAAQDVALARAAVEEAAIAHAKAKLSATVVRRAIDRYRRLHQDPLLSRANELFKRFTLGSFIELFVDLDERGQGVLIGRQRDRIRKRVPEMSTGTREQLFLALRIAAIERYVATSGPVPVVFDDVFIESDEPRSERIFGALGELALKTQVIVLTHHRHLINVGRRALAEKLVVAELPDMAPALREAVAA
ncbi:MAG TPA: AAA family ATPase [Solirubrobacteraceae bacterium]|jgi:uncharacterized protein YhaN|nr:AAA family ATPase [Solirubrobacteraceae bacterium]